MNKKGSILLGIGALVFMVALNLGHAIDKYGILKGNLSFYVLADSSSSGSDSSGSGSSGGGSGSTVVACHTKGIIIVTFTPCPYGGVQESGSASWECEGNGEGGPCELGYENWLTDCWGHMIYHDAFNLDLSFVCIR